MQNNENVKIKEMYREERPYEKCEQYGAENLTDAELLAVLLRTGTKGENSLRLAQKILHPETDRGGHCEPSAMDSGTASAGQGDRQSESNPDPLSC